MKKLSFLRNFQQKNGILVLIIFFGGGYLKRDKENNFHKFSRRKTMPKKTKKFKDYGLIRFFGKESKTFKVLKKHREEAGITFTVGDAPVPVEFVFEKQVATYVRYEVSDIYTQYANKSKFPECKDFMNAFCKENSFFKIDSDMALGNYISCDLKAFNSDKTVSQGFFNLAIFTGQMSEFLGIKDDMIRESDIREYNLHYLTKTTNICKYSSIGSLVAAIACLILGIVVGNNPDVGGFFGPLLIIIFVAGLVSAGFFFAKFTFFDHLRRHAKR